MFKTTNGGGSWVAVSTGLAIKISSLAIDPVTPTTMYAGTEDGVFKTTNGGGNWFAVNSGLLNTAYGMSVPALAIDPVTPGTVYAATGGKVGEGMISRVFKTTNGGASWAAVNTGLPLIPIEDLVHVLAIDPVTPTRVYAGTYGFGVFSIDFVGSQPPADGGGGGGGGGGGCAMLSTKESDDQSPIGLILTLLSPVFVLVMRKTIRRSWIRR